MHSNSNIFNISYEVLCPKHAQVVELRHHKEFKKEVQGLNQNY